MMECCAGPGMLASRKMGLVHHSRSPTTTGLTRASATRLVLEVGVKNRILCREALREKFRRNHPHLSRDAWTGRLDLARALNSGGSHSILAITISNYK